MNLRTLKIILKNHQYKFKWIKYRQILNKKNKFVIKTNKKPTNIVNKIKVG